MVAESVKSDGRGTTCKGPNTVNKKEIESQFFRTCSKHATYPFSTSGQEEMRQRSYDGDDEDEQAPVQSFRAVEQQKVCEQQAEKNRKSNNC